MDTDSYVVLNSGDTLFGEVQRIRTSKRGMKFLKKLHYTPENGRRKKFQYSEVSAYTTEGEIYKKYNLEQVTDQILVKSYYRFVPYGGEATFLRVWVEGPLSHYEYKELNGREKNITRYPLLKIENKETLVKISTGFLGTRKKVLADYFASCPVLQEKIKGGILETAQEIVQFYYKSCL